MLKIKNLNDKRTAMIGRDWRKRPLSSVRANHQETLIDEMLRERAAVLARAGFAVEDALAKLLAIDREIYEKITCLSGAGQAASGDDPVFQEINDIIDKFNVERRNAEVKYYYLIVTREAMGLRRHETVQKLYAIPPKKKKMQTS